MNKTFLIKIITVSTTLLFLFITFKNIQYPLLWNDEGETAVFGNQVLRYGYPKVHDDKNTFFHLVGFFDINAYNPKIDAFFGNVWGQFYLAAPLLVLASNFNDPYLKTLILRGGFAVMGVIGVLVFPLLFGKYFMERKTKWLMYLLFVIIELTSIPLLLHIRQFRVYPLIICIIPFLLYKIINLNNKLQTTEFILLAMLFILFNLSYVVYFSVLLTVIINSLIKLRPFKFKREEILYFIKRNKLQWYGLSIISVLPLIIFYQILPFSLGIAGQFGSHQYSYMQRINLAFGNLLTAEMLLPVLLLYFRVRGIKNKNGAIIEVLSWMIIFIFVSVFVACLNPFYFTRYLIHLQPIISMSFILVAYCAVTTINKNNAKLVAIIMLWITLIILPLRLFWVNNYMSELSRPVHGVLDYIVFYVNSHYKNPELLILATNYEEMPLAYYLNSKVIIGFSGVNYTQEKFAIPDILIPRRSVASVVNSLKMVDDLLINADYSETILPVVDYPVNNIPELIVYPRHIFKTLVGDNEKNYLNIYEKK